MHCSFKFRAFLACCCFGSIACLIEAGPASAAQPESSLQQLATEIETLNQKDDGYRGIWYFNQGSGDQYVYKYSGGLGTYCAKHRPFAVYCPSVDKTFFCYGGTTKRSNRQLVHMVSYFDHRTGMVTRPTRLLNKHTSDAHDNPIISIDNEGYVWIFSTSHGRARPSFVHRSSEPYSIEQFQRIDATYLQDGIAKPLDNFSYMQVWPREQGGFASFFTRYSDPAARTLIFMTSTNGVSWSEWQRLAAIAEGHYQVSAARGDLAATAFNYHPRGKGLNHRTNLYYMETTDDGQTWHSAGGTPLTLPVVEVNSAALVRDFASLGKNVYLKDIQFDEAGRPVILVITSGGYESGPLNDPRTWTVACWRGDQWTFSKITTSDNNYDMGSLYLEADLWRLIAPTETGPQPFNTGGKMCMWTSRDKGRTWKQERLLTRNSARNHTYARRPLHAHPDFYAFWADGHGRQPSESRLYFCNKKGDVYQLPEHMSEDYARPIGLSAAENDASVGVSESR